MQYIKHTGKFYTLWQDGKFVKNLSTNLEKAKSKIQGDYKIYGLCDLLKEKQKENISKLPLKNFSESSIEELKLAMQNDLNIRNRVLARRKLITKGYITKYKGIWSLSWDVETAPKHILTTKENKPYQFSTK